MKHPALFRHSDSSYSGYRWHFCSLRLIARPRVDHVMDGLDVSCQMFFLDYLYGEFHITMYVSCFLNLSVILDISIWYIHLVNESLAVRLSVINIHTRCTMHWQNIIGRIGLLLQIRAIHISAIQFKIDQGLVVKFKCPMRCL